MWRQLILVLAAALVLLALIVFSQWRAEPQFVSGILEADQIHVGSRVGGRVSRVMVEEGASVEPGDQLVELEPHDLHARLREAEAELAGREAVLEKLVRGWLPEEVDQAEARYRQLEAQLALLEAGPRAEEISAARNRLVAAAAQTRLAEREFQRISGLLESKSVSQSEVDQATEVLEAARAGQAMRQNELAALESGSRPEEIAAMRAQADAARLAWELARKGFRNEEIEQARAARDAARAGVDAVRLQLDELVVRSPARGYVDVIRLRPGDLVTANASLLTIVSRDRLWLRTYLPQERLRIAPGQRLPLTVDNFPGQPLEGTVAFVSQVPEFTPGNVQTSFNRARQVYRVHVAVDSRRDELRPGMTANLWLDSAKQP